MQLVRMAREGEDKGAAKEPSAEQKFTKCFGEPVPWLAPNVDSSSPKRELEDLRMLIGANKRTKCGCVAGCLIGCVCCATVLGGCYVWSKVQLVPEGQIGFALESGRPVLLEPGWHILGPLTIFQGTYDQLSARITIGPLTLVRIPQGYLGLARINHEMKVLLPGTHLSLNPLFSFLSSEPVSNTLIDWASTGLKVPIKFVTVPSGFVRVCYEEGKAVALQPGRYAINSATYVVDAEVDMRQENVKFDDHNVMLKGGVNLDCQGLLTYRIVDAIELVASMGVTHVDEAIRNTTKAELAKVFAAITLDQISSVVGAKAEPAPWNTDEGAPISNPRPAPSAPFSAPSSSAPFSASSSSAAPLADEKKDAKERALHHEHEKTEQERAMLQIDAESMRLRLCRQIQEDITPMLKSWGVEVIAFQLESTRLHDQKYRADYEAATLEIANARAQLKSNELKQMSMVQNARAGAMAARITAEGAKVAAIIEAEGRQQAAATLSNAFGQQMRLLEGQASALGSLKARTLVLGPQAPLLSQLLLPPPDPPAKK